MIGEVNILCLFMAFPGPIDYTVSMNAITLICFYFNANEQ